MDLMNRTQLVTEYPALLGIRTWHPVTLSAIGLVILVSLFLVYSGASIEGISIRDGKGRRVKELRTDARLAKFAQSLELSDKGKQLSSDDPYLIHNGKFQELVITQPDHLRDFYRNDTKAHPKPRNLNMGEYFGKILGHAVGVQAGERWRAIRKHFDPEFAYRTSMKAIPKFSAKISQWAEALSAEAVSAPSTADSFVVDMKKPCRFLPFQLVALQFYGNVFDDQLYSKLLEINSLHEMILHDVLLNKRMVSGLWNLLPTAAKKRMDAYLEKWEGFNLDIISYARKNDLACPAEHIYRGVDQAMEMKKSEFLHTVDEILFANVDISSAVLNTLFINLAANKSFQNALRSEITKQKAHENYEVAKYIEKQDSLLNFLVMESMRLTPAFWFSLPECTAVHKTIGGYNVPANTAVVIDARRLNTDPVTWGSDGKAFRPERFADMPQSKCRYGFMRFGAGGGSGRCLGKNVADIVFKLTTLAVVERYVLTTAKGNQAEGATSSEIEFTPV